MQPDCCSAATTALTCIVLGLQSSVATGWPQMQPGQEQDELDELLAGLPEVKAPLMVPSFSLTSDTMMLAPGLPRCLLLECACMLKLIM